jgi:predicted porin
MAQSSVTVYGRLNTSVERQKDFDGVNGSVYRLNNNGSRLGFKGVEDLGGGLYAGFVLEHRFNSDTGTATNPAFWGGAGSSEVYLGSKSAGLVRLGHFTSEAYFATSDVTDLLNHGTGTSADALYHYLGNDDNKVAYRTPSLAGLTAEIGVSAGEGIRGTAATATAAATPARNRIVDFAANYTVGALGLGLGYEGVRDGDRQVAVRASYDFSPFVVTGYVQRYKNDALNASQTVWRLSGMYTLGASEFHLAGGRAGDLGGNNTGAKQYTIGYNYNLSKRTKIYTYYNRVNNDATATTIASAPPQTVQVLDPSTVAFGIRHNF